MAGYVLARTEGRFPRVAGAVLSGGLLLVACATHHPSGAPTPAVSTTAGVPSTSSAAAELRAGLDSGLREGVNLTAFTAQQLALAGSPRSPRVAGALAALNTATGQLSQTLTSTLGPAAAASVLAPWRARVADGVAYAEALLAHDAAATTTTQAALAADGSHVAAALANATGGHAPQAGLAVALGTQARALQVALQAVLAGGAEAMTDVQDAASDMDPVALAMAQGIAAALPAEFSTSPGTPAATLRATLTGDLQQSVADITLGITQASVERDPRAGLALAAAALNANNAALANLIGHSFGAAAGQRFGATWAAQVQAFGSYAQGVAGGAATLTSGAEAALLAARTQLGRQLAGLTRGALSAPAFTAGLQSSAVVLQYAIKAIVGANPQAGAVAGAAESSMTVVAASLASGIATAAPSSLSG
ncbi:MAG: hypothetical protein ACYDB7_00685 [Mycobacteriales bacterium]